MNLTDILIVSGVGAAVIGIIIRQIKNRKSGKST